jgi:hypothetical protein
MYSFRKFTDAATTFFTSAGVSESEQHFAVHMVYIEDLGFSE